MGLLVFFCVRISCFPFVPSMGTCLTGMAYWTITSVTLPPLSWDNSPTNPEQCAFFPTHYWVCTGIERIAEACYFIPSPIFVFFPPPSFFPPSHWNEHFTRPETFNCLLLKKLIETSPLVTFCIGAYNKILKGKGRATIFIKHFLSPLQNKILKWRKSTMRLFKCFEIYRVLSLKCTCKIYTQ